MRTSNDFEVLKILKFNKDKKRGQEKHFLLKIHRFLKESIDKA
jgi:hypothetical protein